MNFNWTCPHCQHAATITDHNFASDSHTLRIPNATGQVTLLSEFFVCPNRACQKFTLFAHLHLTQYHGDKIVRGHAIFSRQMIPESTARVFPTFIPEVLLEDYREACAIKELSPKASATLSRRCLQGMIRDFWRVKPGRLVDEIDAIKSNIESDTWDAIDALRKLGNIGAHMEKDINQIVEVDENEAALLIQLVETLFTDWYVTREERIIRMTKIAQAASAKKPTPTAETTAPPAEPAI